MYVAAGTRKSWKWHGPCSVNYRRCLAYRITGLLTLLGELL